MADWHKCCLGDLAEIYDGPHATPVKADTGPIFLGISNLVNGRIDLSDCEHLSEEDFRRWTRRVTPHTGDVVFSYETRLGEAAFVPEGLRCCLGRRMGLLRARRDRIDSRFLLYAYLGPEFQQTLQSRTVHGSTVDRIPLIDMPEFPICIPSSLDEQRAIAHILGTLDDKIELNRRMNETLETMARAIFKSWFVDFDPVHAKAEGRQPFGMDAVTAALFPNSFEDSALGKIPKRWRIVGLPDQIDFLEGPGLRHWQYSDAGMKFLNIRCIVDGDLDVSSANQISMDEFDETYTHFALREDDIVISTSGTLGRLAIVRSDHLPIMLNTSIIRMRGRESVGLAYVWAFLQSSYFLEEMFALAAGSVQLNFGPMHLKKIKVLLPPEPVLASFERLVQPLVRRVLHNRQEFSKLSAIRDTLLATPISGQITLSDAERVIQRTLS